MKRLPLVLVILSLLPGSLFSQEIFSNIYEGLDDLDNYINNIESSNEQLKKELETLNEDYSTRAAHWEESVKQLEQLKALQKQMSEAYKELEQRSLDSESKLRLWKTLSISGMTLGLIGITVGILGLMVR